MKDQYLNLPGRPGQTISCDGRSGLHQLFEAMVKGMKVRSLALTSATGGGVGKMMDPVVTQDEEGFSICGKLTSNPSGSAKTFRCFRDGRVPEHQELVTVSYASATF